MKKLSTVIFIYFNFLFKVSGVYTPTDDQVKPGSVLLPANRRGRYLAEIIRRQATDGTGINFNRDADRLNAEAKYKPGILSDEILPYIISEHDRRITLYKRVMSALQNGEKGITIVEMRKKPPLIIRKGAFFRCPINRPLIEPDGSGTLACEENVTPTPIPYDSCVNAEDEELFMSGMKDRFYFCNRKAKKDKQSTRNGSLVVGCETKQRTSYKYTMVKCALGDSDDVVVHYRYYPDNSYINVNELDPDHEVCDHWNPCQIGYLFSLPSRDKATKVTGHVYVNGVISDDDPKYDETAPKDSPTEYINAKWQEYISSSRRIEIPKGFVLTSVRRFNTLTNQIEELTPDQYLLRYDDDDHMSVAFIRIICRPVTSACYGNYSVVMTDANQTRKVDKLIFMKGQQAIAEEQRIKESNKTATKLTTDFMEIAQTTVDVKPKTYSIMEPDVGKTMEIMINSMGGSSIQAVVTRRDDGTVITLDPCKDYVIKGALMAQCPDQFEHVTQPMKVVSKYDDHDSRDYKNLPITTPPPPRAIYVTKYVGNDAWEYDQHPDRSPLTTERTEVVSKKSDYDLQINDQYGELKSTTQNMKEPMYLIHDSQQYDMYPELPETSTKMKVVSKSVDYDSREHELSETSTKMKVVSKIVDYDSREDQLSETSTKMKVVSKTVDHDSEEYEFSYDEPTTKKTTPRTVLVSKNVDYDSGEYSRHTLPRLTTTRMKVVSKTVDADSQETDSYYEYYALPGVQFSPTTPRRRLKRSHSPRPRLKRSTSPRRRLKLATFNRTKKPVASIVVKPNGQIGDYFIVTKNDQRILIASVQHIILQTYNITIPMDNIKSLCPGDSCEHLIKIPFKLVSQNMRFEQILCNSRAIQPDIVLNAIHIHLDLYNYNDTETACVYMLQYSVHGLTYKKPLAVVDSDRLQTIEATKIVYPPELHEEMQFHIPYSCNECYTAWENITVTRNEERVKTYFGERRSFSPDSLPHESHSYVNGVRASVTNAKRDENLRTGQIVSHLHHFSRETSTAGRRHPHTNAIAADQMTIISSAVLGVFLEDFVLTNQGVYQARFKFRDGSTITKTIIIILPSPLMNHYLRTAGTLPSVDAKGPFDVSGSDEYYPKEKETDFIYVYNATYSLKLSWRQVVRIPCIMLYVKLVDIKQNNRYTFTKWVLIKDHIELHFTGHRSELGIYTMEYFSITAPGIQIRKDYFVVVENIVHVEPVDGSSDVFEFKCEKCNAETIKIFSNGYEYGGCRKTRRYISHVVAPHNITESVHLINEVKNQVIKAKHKLREAEEALHIAEDLYELQKNSKNSKTSKTTIDFMKTKIEDAVVAIDIATKIKDFSQISVILTEMVAKDAIINAKKAIAAADEAIDTAYTDRTIVSVLAPKMIEKILKSVKKTIARVEMKIENYERKQETNEIVTDDEVSKAPQIKNTDTDKTIADLSFKKTKEANLLLQEAYYLANKTLKLAVTIEAIETKNKKIFEYKSKLTRNKTMKLIAKYDDAMNAVKDASEAVIKAHLTINQTETAVKAAIEALDNANKALAISEQTDNQEAVELAIKASQIANNSLNTANEAYKKAYQALEEAEDSVSARRFTDTVLNYKNNNKTKQAKILATKSDKIANDMAAKANKKAVKAAKIAKEAMELAKPNRRKSGFNREYCPSNPLNPYIVRISDIEEKPKTRSKQFHDEPKEKIKLEITGKITVRKGKMYTEMSDVGQLRGTFYDISAIQAMFPLTTKENITKTIVIKDVERPGLSFASKLHQIHDYSNVATYDVTDRKENKKRKDHSGKNKKHQRTDSDNEVPPLKANIRQIIPYEFDHRHIPRGKKDKTAKYDEEFEHSEETHEAKKIDDLLTGIHYIRHG